MRPALLLLLSLSCVGICQAQTSAPAATPTTPTLPPAATATGVIEKRVERIHIEDAGASIDELRVGGETKTITVQPKSGLPAYQVQPGSGERSWKILGF